MAKGPPLVPLTQLDSAFQLQEHLKALWAKCTHDESFTHTVAINHDTAQEIATPPQLSEGESVDKNMWLYELCRLLTQKANLVFVELASDNPPCSVDTCPEMRASEWQYLCAVHEPPKSCSAFDYINHTLDWAGNLLTSPKHFPSRVFLGGETGNVLQSMRQLTNIFRRVYRIFAHAWFQHREVFWKIESTYGIYILFKTVCDKYQLIPEDNYTVPPEAEGPRDDAETPINTTNPAIPSVQILRRDDTPSTQTSQDQPVDPSTTVSAGATTRRHKHTPSTGSHVTTIAETTEEEDDDNDPQPQDDSTTQISITPLPSTSPPKPSKPSPQRGPPVLGRLDIAGTVPAYVPSNPEDPTPTTATSDKDPLSAARFPSPSPAKPAKPIDPIAEEEALMSPATPDKQKNASPERPGEIPEERAGEGGRVDVKVRRDSGLESEVRSPGGGSFRTAGTDMLSAILGHIDDDDISERGENEGGVEEVKEAEEVKTEAAEKGAEEMKEQTAVKESVLKDEAGVKEGEEGEDDDETMEEIKLPERNSPQVEQQ